MAQLCRTAPSICSGQPTDICDFSRSPSPFCSIIVPNIGTSIEALRPICARLQFHVSDASRSRLASSATGEALVGEAGLEASLKTSNLTRKNGQALLCDQLKKQRKTRTMLRRRQNKRQRLRRIA